MTGVVKTGIAVFFVLEVINNGCLSFAQNIPGKNATNVNASIAPAENSQGESNSTKPIADRLLKGSDRKKNESWSGAPHQPSSGMLVSLGGMIKSAYKGVVNFFKMDKVPHNTVTETPEKIRGRRSIRRLGGVNDIERIDTRIWDFWRRKRNATEGKTRKGRSFIDPYPILRSYLGRRYAITAMPSIQTARNDDFISRRSYVPVDANERPNQQSDAAADKMKKIKNDLRNFYRMRTWPYGDPSSFSRSVKIFKRMKKKLGGRKKVGGREPEVDYFAPPEGMSVQPSNEVFRGPKSQFKCKTGTNGLLVFRDGRTVSSRGLTYSEDDGSGLKSLLCKSETSEISKPDEDTLIKNTVTGLNVITTDTDPFKFLERDDNVDQETLQIGSKAISSLDATSNRNQSVSSVGTHDKEADSSSRVNTKFIYDESGARTGFETTSDVEGSSSFNMTDGRSPIILTSKQEETSAIVQNPKKHLDDDGSHEDGEDIATLINYKKKTDFDIAFRNMFDC